MNACEDREELLSLHATGELEEVSRRELDGHLAGCAACREALEQFRDLTRLSAAAGAPSIDPGAASQVLARVRTALAADDAAGQPVPEQEVPEVMTLEDAARFLRVPLEDLTSELDSLPVFEIGGHLRLRRERLLEWIAERERRQRGERTRAGRY